MPTTDGAAGRGVLVGTARKSEPLPTLRKIEMHSDSKLRGYWREEFSLIGLLLIFFIGIVAFSYNTPFDARLFPVIIGVAGIALTLLIAVEQVRLRRTDEASV